MTPLRDKAIDVLTALDRASMDVVNWPEAVDALLAAGMLADPEECARTYSLISELIATGKDDDAERAYRLAVKAWRRARDVADGKPLAQRDGEARIERAARAMFYDKFPDGSDALWEHLCAGFLRSARAALAAADKEEPA